MTEETADDVGLDSERFLPFLERALEEDQARADVTVHALGIEDSPVTAHVIAKEEGVICGLPLMAPLFHLLDGGTVVEAHMEDGEILAKGMHVLTVEGPGGAVLTGERTALNLLQRLSGVATHTARFVEHTLATGTGIYDTRKTTPGLRELEKYAVRCGGGCNHRMDLSDAAMIKENHLVTAYGTTGPDAVARAVRDCKASLPEGVALYVEVENQAEFEAAVGAGATVIMLDDWGLADIRVAVNHMRTLSPPRPRLEVTGGVDLAHIEAYASTGVHRISIGRITHSAPALDLSMKIQR